MIAWLLATALADELRVVVLDPRGEPVAAAVVTAAGEERTTEARGRAAFDLPAGSHVLTVDAPGFREVLQQVELPRRRPLRVQLGASDADLEVVVEGLRTTPHASRHVVDAEQAMETPGTLDDAVRLVQALPGVTVQREYSPTSGDLSVRGSAPGDSRYFLDGVEIPYLYHFNQYASVFPTSQIGTLQLLPSTFGPSFGDAVGGVVDARSRLDVPRAAHGGAHVNFVMVGGDVKTPLRDDLWVSASGRRSYQDLAGEQTTQYPVWPVFHDFVLRVEHGDAEAGTGAFVMGAGDSYHRAIAELDVVDPVEAEQSAVLDYGESFEIFGVHHRFSSERVRGRAVAAAVGHRRSSALSDRGASDLRQWTGVVRADLADAGDPVVGWEAGLELRSSQTELAIEPGGPDALRVAEEAPLLALGQAVDATAVRQQLGAYGGLRLGSGAVRMLPGLRVESDSQGLPRVEPRAAVRWVPREGTALKLAGGRYTQAPSTDLRLLDPTLPVTSSWQLAAGLEQVAGRVEVGIDGYLKTLRDPLFSDVGEAPRAVPVGEAAGLEVHSRYRLRERLFVWGWLALQRSLIGVDGRWVAADGDQRVAGGAVLSWDVGRTNLGARYRLASGLPFTPLQGSVYDAGRDTWSPLMGSPNGARLPLYQKVDLRVAYTWNLPGWTLTASAEVWLVPRSSAQLYPTWSYDYREQGWVSGPTVLPLLGLRARF